MGAPVTSAVVWSDYLCPWCYLGLHRSAHLESLGVSVTPVPFELHPEVPEHGWSVDEGQGRRLYDQLATECEAAGLEFRRPGRIPNSRRALATSEWVRVNAPAAHRQLHRALFQAVFVDGHDVGDPAVVDALVSAAGADAATARTAYEAGDLDAPLDDWRERATDHGVAATPAWLVDDRLVIAGVQSPEYLDRVVTRLRR